ncbi:hypothetical protein E2C01_072742 [Portunus trituberculatus]|uniref:Secreted protein n=1 Tax=Portunus trituberculatus TaxID=210409 RepID=A0A5B7I9R0_PORTR|nr:hypothetical protein [Portunus trituberculatus]
MLLLLLIVSSNQCFILPVNFECLVSSVSSACIRRATLSASTRPSSSSSRLSPLIASRGLVSDELGIAVRRELSRDKHPPSAERGVGGSAGCKVYPR